jgi:Holliday junction resolvase-like predicted endonuclease
VRHAEPGKFEPAWRFAEERAAWALTNSGYVVLERNAVVRTRRGNVEVDIVALDPRAGEHVLVEVKCRRRDGAAGLSLHVTPESAVDEAKVMRLTAAARSLAALNRWEPSRVRIDVVAAEVVEDGSSWRLVALRHSEGIDRKDT